MSYIYIVVYIHNIYMYIYIIYTFIYIYIDHIYTHSYILLYDAKKQKNVHISYKIVTKTGKYRLPWSNTW